VVPSLPSQLCMIASSSTCKFRNTKKTWESKKPSLVQSTKNTTKARTPRVAETAPINIKNCILYTGGVPRILASLRVRDKTSTQRRWKRTKIASNIVSQLMIANMIITNTHCILCFPNTPDACHKNQKIWEAETFFEPRVFNSWKNAIPLYPNDLQIQAERGQSTG